MSITDEVVVSAGDVETRAPKVPKWEQDAREQIKAVRAIAKHAAAMRERDANEGDTRLLVTDVLVDALGYDKYADLSTEYAVRGEFADYGLRIDGQLVAMIEVKRAAQKLTERHLRQVEAYGLKEGVSWLILTNGVEWQVYHLDTTEAGPVKVTLALTVDFTNLRKQDMEMLLVLHKQMFKRGRLDVAWTRISALAPENVRQTMMSARVITAVRQEIKSAFGLAATDDDVRAAIKEALSV